MLYISRFGGLINKWNFASAFEGNYLQEGFSVSKWAKRHTVKRGYIFKFSKLFLIFFSTLTLLDHWICQQIMMYLHYSGRYMQSFGTVTPIVAKAPNSVQMRLIL